ncbi:MAG TPA: hypothetical protein VN694_04145 [Caulobacteraceae bacterium]|nr:hypothetical protein [Caulobacteraceae bacterium]
MPEALKRRTDDIDLWTREFAEEQARQAGVPVRAWLDEFVAREAARAVGQPPDHHSQRALTTTARASPAGASQQPSHRVDESAFTDPVGCWSPAREAFGQRGTSLEAQQTVEAARVSAASILARAVDDGDPVSGEPAEHCAAGEALRGELGVRARVSRAQASARRRLDGEEIERLLGASATQTATPGEIETQASLSEIERALREMREQMDAAVQLAETAALVATPPSPLAPEGSEQGEASTEAIAHLGLDIARLVEVMDCGFDRVEAANARQSLELRNEVSQMFDELAARIEKFERQSADPRADETPLAAEPCEVGVESAPPVEANGGEGPRADDAGEAEAPALSGLASHDGDTQRGEAPAADDPDSELFEDSRSPVAEDNAPHVAAADEPGEASAWPQSALPSRPSTESAGEPRQAQATDDPDSDLFDPPPEGPGHDSHDCAVDEVRSDPFESQTSDAADTGDEDDSASELWFGRTETHEEWAADWRTPDQEMTDIAGSDPFDQAGAEVGDHAPGAGARRVHFPWLHFRRGGQSRKSA